MKKPIFKTITVFMLFAISLSLPLLNGCQKNVGDVYDYAPVVLAPDFEIVDVAHAFDNEELNSDSWLTFKVTYKNNEVSETSYPSVLNFYVNGILQQSTALNDIAGNTNYESIFEFKAQAGEHIFKFEINLSSDGNTMVDEENTTNNKQETSLNIAVKQLAVVQEVVVEPAVVDQAIAADETANVASVLADEEIIVSTAVEAVATTFDDNTTAVIAAVQNADGTIDPTKVVLSVTNNPGVSQGQEQQTVNTMLVETLVEQKEVSFYNAIEKLTYTDGVVAYESLKSAQADDCTEPTNLEALSLHADAYATYTADIAANMAALGDSAGLATAPQVLIKTLAAYELTQGNIDNPPTLTLEIMNSNTACSEECVNEVKVVTYGYPGFTLRFTDDRGTIDPIEKDPSCAASNAGTYSASDCGGNSVSYTFSQNSRAVTITETPCVENIHN